MDTRTLIDLIEFIDDEASIYLLAPLSKTAGFFANKKKLLYLAKDTFNYQYEGIVTDYLHLQTHVRISSVKNNQTFNDDDYNLIMYRGKFTDANIDSFVQLCSIHANNADELTFKEFFYSLIALFQLPVEQGFKNAVGLYGELKFMQYANEHYGVDISSSWHRSGSYSQYDFSNGETCMEVKTTLSDQADISIKHQQIFSHHPCYLVVVNCERYDNGETLEGLISSMHQDTKAFNGINFSINLAKELKRISLQDIKELQLDIRQIQIFNTAEINPLPVLPDNISHINYQLNISDLNELDETITDSIIETF